MYFYGIWEILFLVGWLYIDFMLNFDEIGVLFWYVLDDFEFMIF